MIKGFSLIHENKQIYAIPDALGRIVLTGTCKNVLTYTSDPLKNILVRADWEKASNTYKGYAITGIQLTSPTVLSVNYYDNYECMGLNGIPASSDTNFKPDNLADYGVQHAGSSKGMLTASMTALLDGSTTMLYSIMYYDNRGRLIQTKANNHLAAGVEKEYIAYNFVGEITKRMQVHSATGKISQTEYYAYQYDHAGRLLSTKHKLNSGAEVAIAENTYNELGQLLSNKKNNQPDLLTNYTYNIRSWTKSITSNHFIENLEYTYNGNIKSMEWTQDGPKNRYDYSYDNLSQLTKAAYTTYSIKSNIVGGIALYPPLDTAPTPVVGPPTLNPGGPTLNPGGPILNPNFPTLQNPITQPPNPTTEQYATSYSYDKHGNMKSLTREGKITASTYGTVDNLTFTYTGNQLLKATDAIGSISLAQSADFKDYANQAVEYAYNKNGAMTKDLNKGISHITYNCLNLPQQMDIKSPLAEARNEYLYSAGGAKLRVVSKWNTNFSTNPLIGSDVSPSLLTKTKTSDYVGNKVYENGVLKRILIDGGYIENGLYHFYLTDHLGNNRTVAKLDGSIVQRTQYYPFGMAFADGLAAGIQPYKFGSKELDAEHGLMMYDYSARYYNGISFTSIDPLAEKYYSISPYVYCANNPIRYVDPTGMAPEDGFLSDLLKAINQVGQQVLSTVGLSRNQLQAENPAIREDASQKRKDFTETMHSVNETMLSVVPGADVAYKVANDREVTKGDIAWAVMGFVPAGKIAKGASIWSKTKTLSAVENALIHWQKHGKEFSEFQNAKQYVEGAKDFLHNSPSGTLMKVRLNGDIQKYYPKTNTFGVMDATGTPRTMFRPVDGIKYWKKQ